MAPIKPRPPRRQRPPLPSIRAWCKHNWKNTQRLAQQNSRFTGILLATLALGLFLIVATVRPSSQSCEGSLTLSSLSFESTASQPFLLNTPVRQISLIGKIPLRLTGPFSNNPALQNATSLDLTPLDDNATLQITLRPNASLDLIDLPLTPKNQVNQLRYDSYKKRLTFQLDNAQNTQLTLNLGGPLTVQLTGYKINSKPNLSTNESFTWQPDNQLTLTLATATKLDLEFTEFTERSFWGRLAVKNVKLTVPTDFPDFKYNYLESTILAGSVRLADKTASLEANQYLHFNPTNSIDTLLNLSLSEEKAEITSGNDPTLKLNTSAPGLTLDFSGRTERIDIGLNPKNPVIRLQASFLESWIPRDAIIGLIAFLSTLVMTLIGWLWEIASDSSQP